MAKPRNGRIDFIVPEPLKKLAEMSAARENYETLSEYLRTMLWKLVDREMTKDEQGQFLKLLYPDVELGDIGESTSISEPKVNSKGERMLTDEDLDRYPQVIPNRPGTPRRLTHPPADDDKEATG